MLSVSYRVSIPANEIISFSTVVHLRRMSHVLLSRVSCGKRLRASLPSSDIDHDYPGSKSALVCVM